ncbi:MAG TPA: carbohydrate kinase family protein [Methylomirabilota bacterium]|nr:carbohydrate kinase family protein [Methylomirabilota bacterium]
MKVLGIGESVIDNAYIMNRPHVSEKHVGGPSLIALLLLSRLGIDCTLLTTLGRDEEAEIIKKTLKHENVKLLAKLQKHTKVNNYIINSENGSRKKVRGDIEHPPMKHLDRNFIRQFDIIIIDRHEPLAFYEILKKKKTTAKIIIDPSTEISALTLDMIKYADYPIIPIEALIKLEDCRNLSSCLDSLHKITRKTVVITAGELGSIIYDGKNFEVIPTLHIQAVDVQGAGDVYRGAFIYGVLQNWEIKECVRYANKVAALHCTKIGNAAALPTKKEIANLSNKLKAKEVTMPTIAQYFAQL